MDENIDRLQDDIFYRGKAYQQLVINRDGKAQWEDQLAYDGRIEISWDCDTTGRINFTDPWKHIYYKISDLTPTKEEIIGGTIKFSSNHDPVIITQDMTHDIGEGTYVTGLLGEIIVSFGDNLEIQDAIIVPERGTYVCYDEAIGYAKSLTYGKIKQLDEKFLPSAPNQLLNAVFIQHEIGNKSSITCNLTYEQIREQIENDLPIVAVYRYSGSAQRNIIISYEISEGYIAFFTKVDKSDGFGYHSDGTFGELTPA